MTVGKNNLFNQDAYYGMRDMEDKSVDLIFTSPPHITETKYTDLAGYVSFQQSFCYEFMRIIKDDGFVVICQANHRFKGRILSNYRNYYEFLTDKFTGLTLKDEKIVYRRPPVGRKDLYRFTYQIMTVWTRKGKFKRSGDFLADTYVDEQSKGKGFTHWTDKFCRLVISALTEPGQLVLDPFAANAPVLTAARDLKRNYIGFEIDPDIYAAGAVALDTVKTYDDIVEVY